MAEPLTMLELRDMRKRYESAYPDSDVARMLATYDAQGKLLHQTTLRVTKLTSSLRDVVLWGLQHRWWCAVWRFVSTSCYCGSEERCAAIYRRLTEDWR